MEPLDSRLVRQLDLTGVAITAQIQTDGTLLPVGGVPAKLMAAAGAKSMPRIHSIVVAQAQSLDSFALVPEDTNPNIFKTPNADLHVIRAGSVPEAVHLLTMDAKTRWVDIDCKIPSHETFVGREHLIHEIDQYIATHRSGYLVLTGSMGKGKSALLSHLIARAVAQNQAPVFHIVGGYSSLTAQPQQVAACLYRRLQRKYVFPEPPEWARWNAADKLERLLQHVSEVELGPAAREILYLDAPDQVRSEPHQALIPDILRPLPPNIFCIITCRPRLDWLDLHHDVTVWEMDKRVDDRTDVQNYLTAMRQLETVELSDSLLQQIVSQKEPPVFFTVAQRMRQLAAPQVDAAQKRDLDDPARWTIAPETLIADEARHLVRQALGFHLAENRIWQTLGLYAVAREPISEAQLTQWDLWEEGTTDRLMLLASNFFTVRPLLRQPELPYEFAHPGYHDQVLKHLSARETAARHHALVQSGLRWREFDGKAYEYALRYTSYHAASEQNWEIVETLLADSEWVAARIRAGFVADHVADLAMAQSHIPLNRAAHTLLRVLQADTPERIWLGLRRALYEFFGSYQNWSPELCSALETSSQPAVLEFLADTLEMQQEYTAAAGIYEKLLSITSAARAVPYARATIRMANVYVRMGRDQDALRLLDEVFRSEEAPKQFAEVYAWGQYHRALLLAQFGQIADAIHLLEEVRKLTPGSSLAVSALHQLGVMQLEQHELERAEEIFTRCLQEHDPSDWNFRRAHEYRRLGQVYAMTGRSAQASAAFEQAVQISTQCGDQRYALLIKRDRDQWLV